MPKCFLTGVEIDLDDAYVLDISRARHALRDLRQKASALERLIAQLSPKDEVEAFDYKAGANRKRKDRRLVSERMAIALSDAAPETTLLIRWPDWRARRSRPILLSSAATENEEPG